MEADVFASSDAPKPGCEKRKSKHSKLKGSNLIKGLQEFDEKLNKLIEENKQLKKDHAEERHRGNQERAEKFEEQKRRQQLEKENHDLKAEISSYKKKGNVRDENEDGNELLKDRLIAAEGELMKLKELYLEEKMDLENEIKEATSDKMKAIEALQLMKNEMNKVEDDKKVFEKKSEEYTRCLGKAKYEIKELTEKLKAEISKTEEGEVKKLKELYLEEKMKLENEIKKATSDKLKAVEALMLVKSEKNKLEDEKKAIEKKSAEYMQCLKKAKYEIKELTEKLKAEFSKMVDSRNFFESEKLNIAEKVRADIHKKLISEQKKHVDIERKKTNEQKARVEHLTQVLEEEKQTREKLQKKIEDFESIPKRKCSTCSSKDMHHHRDNSPANENTILLRKMCKLLKEQAKHAAKKANPEKIYIVQEPQFFQQSLMDLSNRVNLLDARLTQRIEGIDVLTESGIPQRTNEVKEKSNLLDSKITNHQSKDSGATKMCCSGNANFSGPISELAGAEPYNGMNKSQTSAICSNTSYSDKRLVGSKERDSIAALPSTNVKLKHANKRSTTMNLSTDIPKLGENKKKCILANSVDDRGSNKEHVCSSKRRKIHDSSGDKLSVYKKDVMNLESNVFPPTCSKKDEVTQQDKRNRQMNTEPHFIRTELDDLITFEKMIRGNCLKLLDMDSIMEEEKYRKAVEMPLSPTLPDLEPPRQQLQVEGDNQCVVKKDDPLTNITKSSTGSVVIVQNEALAAVNTTPVEFVDNAPINIRSPPENQIRSPGTRKIPAGDRNTSVGITLQDGMHNHLNVSKQPILCGVVHSDIKDKDSISRIICTRNTFTSQNINASPLDHLVVQVHNVIARDTAFVPREKGSVLLSLLICNISSRISVDFKSTLRKFLLPCFETSVAEMNNVISNADTKALFEETCCLDVLTCLLEDFLIEKRTLVYWDKLYDNGDTSSIVYQFDGKYILSKPATIDQFIAGCIILASISSAANRVGFLLQTSYKILRMCKTEDVSWILSALHIFASVNGNKYFAVDEHKFLTVALNSLVQLIETRTPFTGPCNSSHYKECSFATGALCMEKLAALFLDALQCFISGIKDQNVHNSNYFSVSTAHDGVNNISSGSNLLFTFIKHDDDVPGGFLQRAYCHINDIISLLELIGCYMSWEWTWNKIVPAVLKILESCPTEEFSIALLNLTGQLGRFGNEAHGHKSNGLSEIRHSISMFLDTKTASLRTQFAAASALLNLLPYTLKEIADENFDPDKELSNNATAIKSWFSGLSEQNQSLCFSFFP